MTDTNITDDLVLPFQLEKISVRGRLVRLGDALNTILHRHDYPVAVGTLLGETTCLALALATMLKFDGVFTLQAKSDGAVRFLVTDVAADGGIRSYAQFDREKIAGSEKLLGQGHMAFTVDRLNKDERYQGVVALEGDNLAEAVQHYFRQSEQIPTGLVVAVKQDDKGQWRGGCIMLQRMPRDGGIEVEVAQDTSVEDDWHRAMLFLQSCKPEELTDEHLPAEELLYRLFHEDDARVYEAKPIAHKCHCSSVRVANMLRSLPRDEVEALAIDGVTSVTCEFCNQTYSFTAAQRDELYSQQPDSPAASPKA